MGQKYVYNPLTCEYDIINEGAPGVPGPRGPVGASGPAGAPGEGVPTGGNIGQVLAKAGTEDYNTEWVDQSGGSNPGLQEVLDQGESASGVRLAIDGLAGGPDEFRTTEVNAFALHASYDDGSNSNYSIVSAGEAEVSSSDGSTTKSVKLVSADPSILISNEYDSYVLQGTPSSTGGGTFHLPATSGAEIIATREWVINNGGGGGGAIPSLDQVLNEHNESATPVVITDSMGTQASLSMNSLNIEGLGQGVLSPDLLRLTPDAVIEAKLSGADGLSLTTNNLDTYALKGDPNPTGGGTVYLPSTSGPETLATREWVTNNGGGGGGGTTPTLDDVLNAGSTSAHDLTIEDVNVSQYSSIGVNTIGAYDGMNMVMAKLEANDFSGGKLILGDSMGNSTLMKTPDELPSTFYLPGGSGYANETIATREWVSQNGDTSSRPAAPTIGDQYFDTTLNKPIWYGNTGWVDATGTGV